MNTSMKKSTDSVELVDIRDRRQPEITNLEVHNSPLSAAT